MHSITKPVFHVIALRDPDTGLKYWSLGEVGGGGSGGLAGVIPVFSNAEIATCIDTMPT